MRLYLEREREKKRRNKVHIQVSTYKDNIRRKENIH